MALATKSLQYARSSIREGSTWLENNVLPREEQENLSSRVQTMREHVKSQREQWLKNNLWLKDTPLDSSVYFHLCLKHALLERLGNCMELSTVALYFALQTADQHLLHSDSHYLAEVVQTKDQSHAFVIFGRLRNSDLTDPKTWGKNAVVCDPWANRCYAASTIASNLQGFSQDENRYNQQVEISSHPLVKPFDISWNTDALADSESGLKSAGSRITAAL